MWVTSLKNVARSQPIAQPIAVKDWVGLVFHLFGRVLPYTYDTRSRNQRQVVSIVPAPVSGTCVVQIWDRVCFVWDQIPTPLRTRFYSKPESGVHVTEMIIYDLFIFSLPLATVTR